MRHLFRFPRVVSSRLVRFTDASGNPVEVTVQSSGVATEEVQAVGGHIPAVLGPEGVTTLVAVDLDGTVLHTLISETPVPGTDPIVVVGESSARGRFGFNATTKVLRLTGPGPHFLAVLDNPADSTMDLYLDRGEWGTSQAVIFSRHRGSKVTALNDGQPITNRGGTDEVSEARFYAASDFTVVDPGVVSKTLHTGVYTQPAVVMNGDLRLRPGRRGLWSVECLEPIVTARTVWTASVFLQWWERPKV